MNSRNNRTIKKKVFFYYVMIDGERATGAAFNFAGFSKAVQSMPFTVNGRYLRDFDDAYLTVHVIAPRAIRFGRIRRSNLPLVVDGPRESTINVTAHGGLLESCHIVFFPPNIIASEFNFYAPRVSRFADYFRAKAAFTRELEFVPIIAMSPLQTLQRFGSLKAVSVKVATQLAPELRRRKTGPIAAVVEASAGSAEYIDVTLSAARGRNNESIGRALYDGLRNLVGIPNVREIIDKVGVKGYFAGQTKLEAVDLLEDELVSTQSFMRESVRGRVLDDTDAIEKIRMAYTEVRPDQLQ